MRAFIYLNPNPTFFLNSEKLLTPTRVYPYEGRASAA